MRLADDSGLQAVEDAIMAADIPPVPAVLVGYLLMTEWVGTDGETYLVESAPDSQPYWKTLGFIEATKASLFGRIQHTGDDE